MQGSDADSGLRFPDVPKLELDQLIDQLVDRAFGVKRAQGRLRSLLRAIGAVTGELSLDAVLRNLAEAARELVSARYAALGVVGPDGSLEQFLPAGTDAATAAAVSRMVDEKGLLQALRSDPRPIRLTRLAEDAGVDASASADLATSSFLGVPIHLRDTVFGNLYLTDSAHGAFTAEDEQLIVALASAAGAAVSNARLYDESQRQQRWLAASVEIGAVLLANDGNDPLQLIARRAVELADADAAALSVLTEDRAELLVTVAIGPGAEQLLGLRYAPHETLGGLALQTAEPLRRTAADAERPSVLAPVLAPGPAMALPLKGVEELRGVLTVGRGPNRPPFTDSDLAMAAGFASQASVALELADSRASEEKVAVLEDRERIARDLHDHVVQELFAIGLNLEGVVTLLGSHHPATRRIKIGIEDIDGTIRRIRTSIFALRGSLDLAADGLRQQVVEVAEDLTPALGFFPEVSFAGLVDYGTSAGLAHDIIAVVRETLVNAAKHARATAVSVCVEVDATEVRVTVADNGVGVGPVGRRSGTANLRARAEARGGRFTLGRADPGGTVATWTAHLH